MAVGNIGNAGTMAELGKMVVEKAQAIAPVDKTGRGSHGDPPGALRDSIKVETVSKGSVTIVAGGIEHPAAVAVEFGAGRHDITPRQRRRLAFFWDKPTEGGAPGWYSFRKVDHPPTPAQPFLGPALDSINMLSVIRALVTEAWNSAA